MHIRAGLFRLTMKPGELPNADDPFRLAPDFKHIVQPLDARHAREVRFVKYLESLQLELHLAGKAPQGFAITIHPNAFCLPGQTQATCEENGGEAQ
jgi:hypothetical protein